MFDELLELLNRIAALPFGCPPDEDDEGDSDDKETDEEDDSDSEDDGQDEGDEDDKEEDKTEDSDDTDDDKEEDEEETPLEKSYPERVVKRLRTENKTRRQRSSKDADIIKTLKQELSDQKSGRTGEEKKKKAQASSRLEEEIEDLRSKVSEVTQQRDQLVDIQVQTDQVLTIGKVAQEVGYRNPSDAIAFLGSKSEDFTDSEGDVDEDALRTILEETLEEKPYLGADQAQEVKVKEQKARKVASDAGNPTQKQKMKAQEGKKGKSDSEEDTNKKIRQLLNKHHDGRGAFQLWYWQKYHPTTSKDRPAIS